MKSVESWTRKYKVIQRAIEQVPSDPIPTSVVTPPFSLSFTMSFLIRTLVALLACSALISDSPAQSLPVFKRDNIASTSNSTCTTKTQRKAWRKMTNPEKQVYIDSEPCLINTPADLGFAGAQTKFDELQYCHIWQSNVIHYAFLPWHRYFMYAQEYQLKTICNYTGGQPPDIPKDTGKKSTKNNSLRIADSPVFDTVYGFGGNGQGDDWCVQDGPFANMTIHLGPYYEISDTCLGRQFCWKSNPHSNAHLGVNGTILDTVASPGDSLFYLHHTNLDRLWWE
ncbi:Di-copper centre-containing protein [Acephala macrosclerotiorum]|nr:Di-copper centre-containing protein [Acephala macrosclerotiorum]